MHYVRRIDFSDFAGLIKVAFVIAVIITGLFAGIGSLLIYGTQRDRIAEQNLYYALQGKAVNDTGAMDLAETLRQIYNKEFNNWTKLKEFDQEFVFKYEENVKAILENPETEINVEIISWENWWWFAAKISWLILAIGLSISYPWFTRQEYHFSDEGRYNRWWQYPWRRWWAYPMLLVMLPYVVVTQLAVLVYMTIRKIRGLDKREALEEHFRHPPPRRERTEQIIRSEEAIRKDKEKLQSLVGLISKAKRGNRRRWIKICRESLPQEQRRLKSEIQSYRTKLSGLGGYIEETQRNLAKTEARLNKTREAIDKRARAEREFGPEFERLLRFPLVQAVEIKKNAIHIYTGTICISSGGKRYEIGNFLIRIGTVGNGYIKIKNLCTTSNLAYNHPYRTDSHEWNLLETCFSDLNEKMRQLLVERDYLPLIVVVFQILQRAEGTAAKRLEYWKEVSK